MSDVVFLDTETTGLDPETERIFEIAIVEADGTEHVWRIEPERSVVDRMHPKALEVNRYHERTSHPDWEWNGYIGTLKEVAELIHGKHIVGAVPSFDAGFLTAEYKRAIRVPMPRWHYHLIDVETLAIGFLAAQGQTLPLPWDSDALSRAVRIEPDTHTHEALADALWAKRIYDEIMPPSPRAEEGGEPE